MRAGALGLMMLPAGAGAAGGCPDAEAVSPAVALETVATGLRQPVFLTAQGPEIYVVEQAGRVLRLVEGGADPQPFLDIRDRVESGGEKGLLSIAFHPDYTRNGLVFVNYTEDRGALQTVISRFRRVDGQGLDPTSETVLLRIKQPFPNHNGGQLAFGPDGYLYIGMGDGGFANDPFGHGQDTGTLLGALLRIDVDREAGGRAYAIPADNPFVDRPDVRPEIWAYGFRNPWRFSFDPVTGALYLADVGQDRVEEIDIVRKGGNYGWALMEGDRCQDGRSAEHCRREGLSAPRFVYEHPEGFAVTGGYVYRGAALRGLCGHYLFADYVTGRLWALDTADEAAQGPARLLSQVPFKTSSFGVDSEGEIYMLDHEGGRVMKIMRRD